MISTSCEKMWEECEYVYVLRLLVHSMPAAATIVRSERK